MDAIIGLDTETTPFDDMTPELKLWCVYGDLPVATKKLSKLTNRYRKSVKLEHMRKHGYDSESFNKFLIDIIDRVHETRSHVVIVCHILMFDLDMLKIHIDHPYVDNSRIIENIYEKPAFLIVPVQTAKRSTGSVDTKKIYFTDLANYMGRIPLQSIARSFKLPEKLHETLDIDFDTLPRDYIVTPDIIEYCYRDAEIVYRALKLIKPVSLNRIRLSASSLAFADLKNRSGWKPFQRPYFAVAAERQSYRGGRVEVNPEYRGKWVRAIKYDVHSMYPSVMYDMKVPVEYVEKQTRRTGAYTDEDVFDYIKSIYESENQTAIIKADITILERSIPFLKKNNLVFEKSKYEQGFWTIEEFYPALREDEIIINKVASIFLYGAEKGKFNPFIDHWYPIKSHTDDPIERSRSKLMLNSAYGKFGQRKIVEIDLKKTLGKEYHDVRHYMKDRKFGTWISSNLNRSFNIRSVDGELRSSVKTHDESSYKCTAIASLITSRARRKLWEAMKTSDDWCYVDTDCIVLPLDVDTKFLDIHPNKLGSWWEERCCDNRCNEYKFWNKKDYRCREKFKLKGVPQRFISSENYDTGVFKYRMLSRPKMASKRSMEPYTWYEQTKRHKR